MSNKISLDSFNSFRKHTWVKSLISEYEKLSILGKSALERIIYDLNFINKEHEKKHGYVLFTTIEGRVKTEESFFYKLYLKCLEKQNKYGITEKSIRKSMQEIKDLSGVRFACPYYDKVIPTISDYVRPHLSKLGYATNLDTDELSDKDLLDNGDSYGYRSYHFFVRVPAIVNIYNDAELFTCEVQARSEIEHIWAVKSHDLIYKNNNLSEKTLNEAKQDLKQISNNLRVADHFLVKIRTQVKENGLQ